MYAHVVLCMCALHRNVYRDYERYAITSRAGSLGGVRKYVAIDRGFRNF